MCIKTALYTGLEFDDVSVDIRNNLDYLKFGPWIKELGGLQSKTTNQKLLNLNNGECLNHYFIK